MAVAPYTLRLYPQPPPQNGTPLLPRPHLHRRAAAKVSASWAPAGGDQDDGVGGWWLPERPAERERRTGIGRAIAVGLGASAAIGLAGLAWKSPSSRKCLQQLIDSSFHYIQEKMSTLESQETPKENSCETESHEDEVSSTILDEEAEAITDDSRRNHRLNVGRHVLFSIPVDPVHEDAFSILKKLQIIDNDVSSSEFCTRREFARWFGKRSSKFERKRIQKIIPSKLIAGSGQTAFDDVNTDDPDFLYIQCLVLFLCSPLLPQIRSLSVAAVSTGRRGRSRGLGPVISEGRDDEDAAVGRPVCPGCGVFMQDADPNLPGFFKNPSCRSEDEMGEDGSLLAAHSDGFLEDESISESELAADLEGLDNDIDEFLEEDDEDGGDNSSVKIGTYSDMEGFASDWDLDWEEQFEEDEDEKWRKELDGFAPPGVGYGNITEETVQRLKKEKLSKSERKRRAKEAKRVEAEQDSAVVCARCHSLRNYGLVKNDKAENLIPDFDFDRFISSRLMKRSAGTPVIVMVVDCSDFDGSFPKRAAKSLFKALEGRGNSKLSETPRLVLVGTKVDLLPWEQMGVRLDRWVRGRAKAFGAPKLDAVFLVSVHKDLAVRNLLSYIKESAGPRSNVWVIGAQNAGKSTLINGFAKKQGVKITRLTEAAVPGTTLGILRITGVLPAKAKMYDTPGLLHPYIMAMRLNNEERKMIEIRKELRPRTFRVKAGQSVHIGGLTRLDVLQSSVQTIYITVWASSNVPLHLGKTENAEELREKHFGLRLQPPIEPERVPDLGPWAERRFEVSGVSWDVNSMDIAISGLGWYSLGLKGTATVALWALEGIHVTERDAMILHRAQFLERPGFWLPIAIANAIGEETRKKNEKRKVEQRRREEDLLLEDDLVFEEST